MFKIEEFDIKLDTDVIGRNFYYFDEIDSTNSYLLDESNIKINGSVVLAENQLKGRGRRDRNWTSVKEQSLTFSILLNRNLNAKNINILNLGASLAVAQAIENLYQLDVELKWPNDILVGGKKVAGILLDAVSKGDKIEKVVVGFGINVNQPNFTGKFLIPATSIKLEFKRDSNRERLLSEILNFFESILIQIEKDKSKILSDWRARCKMIGEKIKITDSNGEKFGKFEDIDDEGFLLFESRGILEKIHFGDVSIRR